MRVFHVEHSSVGQAPLRVPIPSLSQAMNSGAYDL
jgi:hypothetical protein